MKENGIGERRSEKRMNEIVKKLREVADGDCRAIAREPQLFEPADGYTWADLMDEAANEIEQYQKLLQIGE